MPSVNMQAPIAEVTVYTDRARVTRRGSAHLDAGEHTVSLINLPTTLQEDSVRASGKGANVRILGVEVVQQYVTEAPEDEAADLQRQLEALQDEDRALADEDEAAANRLDFLKALRDNTASALPRGIAYGKSNMTEVQALSKYLAKEQSDVLARRRAIAQQRRELARQIQILQGKMAPNYDAIQRQQINVYVEATEASDIELDVTYSVTGASWEPLYDIRLVDTKVELTYLANVTQQTGEDWPEVQLSLSTARPAVSTTIPELDPWYVDAFHPPVPMARKAMAPMAAMAAMPADEEAYGGAPTTGLPMPPPMQVAQSTVESTGASVTYKVARPVAVPSDGSPHKTTVTVLELDAKLDYVAVPRIAEEAYLRAKITNSSEYILLPGSANIFHESDFVGSTSLETVVPNQEIEAQLGVDDRVKVERDLSQRETSKTLIGNTRKNIFGFTIKLQSFLTWPTIVTVYDQLPVSRNEQIKSKLLSLTPPATEQTDMNILRWQVSLGPQEKLTISFEFEVDYPRDLNIIGLDL